VSDKGYGQSSVHKADPGLFGSPSSTLALDFDGLDDPIDSLEDTFPSGAAGTDFYEEWGRIHGAAFTRKKC
jgi:hypothetical protein